MTGSGAPDGHGKQLPFDPPHPNPLCQTNLTTKQRAPTHLLHEEVAALILANLLLHPLADVGLQAAQLNLLLQQHQRLVGPAAGGAGAGGGAEGEFVAGRRAGIGTTGKQ